MTKVEFASQTKIGETSLGRWEKGRMLQSCAMDNFLYLLSLPGNLESLQTRHSCSEHIEPVFRHINISPAIREQQAEFSL